ncbi:MAG TPA: flap endonuclease-1 [Thermoplasmata archaeon]|nr:flap endonuclease-1 [Thermoplasmata archaeon]
MGVNLKRLLRHTNPPLEHLSGKTIAVDAYNMIYQFLTSIRDRRGFLFTSQDGVVSSHLIGLFYRLVNLMEHGLKLVFVFDGKPVIEKTDTLAKRKELKEKAREEWVEALKRGDLETARSKAMQSARITPEIVESTKELLGHLKIPWVDAIEDGEAQASYMTMKGHCWAVASQDYDSLLFGCTRLVRNLSISRARIEKARKKGEPQKSHIELIKAEEILKKLGVTREQLVDMAILIGTDFNPGVKGIGPKTSYRLIYRYGSIDKFPRKIVTKYGVDIPQLEELRNIFLNPRVHDDYKLKWEKPDLDALKEFLCEKHNFSKERVGE